LVGIVENLPGRLFERRAVGNEADRLQWPGCKCL